VSSPAAPAYLTVTYASKRHQRGGTLIDEVVLDLETHRERVREPDGYRPERCPRCGRAVHALDRRRRKLRDQPDCAEADIRRYRCRPCHAVWQVLPAVIARYLHRTWGAVQSALVAAGVVRASGGEWRVRRKAGTLSRWCRRLRSSALALTQALSDTGEAAVAEVVAAAGIDCSRLHFAEALSQSGLTEPGRKLEQLACWIHRVVPGLRLM
jgi:hypothetical protein